MRFRRAHALILAWRANKFFIENYLVGKGLSTSPAIGLVLDLCAEFLTREKLEASLGVSDPGRIVDVLIRNDILLAEGSPLEQRDRALQDRWSWQLNAKYFHFSTRDVDYSWDYDSIREVLEEKARRDPPPSPFKTYDTSLTPLPPIVGALPLVEVLDRRRTCRRFERTTISIEEFATIIDVTWGMTRYYNKSKLDRRIIKRSPSGGARHPIEVYPVALRVRGVLPAIYHYDVEHRGLRHVASIPPEPALVELFSGQEWIKDASALFIMTAILQRSMWKYNFSRAYRVMLLDAGHLGQTFHLVATALGLGVFTTAALQDSKIEDILGVDTIDETVLYAGAVGTRSL